MSQQAKVRVSTELAMVVIRCGCTPAQKEAPDFHGRRGELCPQPCATEDRGVVSARFANPLAQRAWEAARRAAGFVPGSVSSPKE